MKSSRIAKLIPVALVTLIAVVFLLMAIDASATDPVPETVLIQVEEIKPVVPEAEINYVMDMDSHGYAIDIGDDGFSYGLDSHGYVYELGDSVQTAAASSTLLGSNSYLTGMDSHGYAFQLDDNGYVAGLDSYGYLIDLDSGSFIVGFDSHGYVVDPSMAGYVVSIDSHGYVIDMGNGEQKVQFDSHGYIFDLVDPDAGDSENIPCSSLAALYAFTNVQNPRGEFFYYLEEVRNEDHYDPYVVSEMLGMGEQFVSNIRTKVSEVIANSIASMQEYMANLEEAADELLAWEGFSVPDLGTAPEYHVLSSANPNGTDYAPTDLGAALTESLMGIYDNAVESVNGRMAEAFERLAAQKEEGNAIVGEIIGEVGEIVGSADGMYFDDRRTFDLGTFEEPPVFVPGDFVEFVKRDYKTTSAVQQVIIEASVFEVSDRMREIVNTGVTQMQESLTNLMTHLRTAIDDAYAGGEELLAYLSDRVNEGLGGLKEDEPHVCADSSAAGSEIYGVIADLADQAGSTLNGFIDQAEQAAVSFIDQAHAAVDSGMEAIKSKVEELAAMAEDYTDPSPSDMSWWGKCHSMGGAALLDGHYYQRVQKHRPTFDENGVAIIADLSETGQGIITDIEGMITGIVDAAAEAFTARLDDAQALVDEIINTATETAESGIAMVDELVQKLVDDAANAITGTVDDARNTINARIDMFTPPQLPSEDSAEGFGTATLIDYEETESTGDEHPDVLYAITHLTFTEVEHPSVCAGYDNSGSNGQNVPFLDGEGVSVTDGPALSYIIPNPTGGRSRFVSLLTETAACPVPNMDKGDIIAVATAVTLVAATGAMALDEVAKEASGTPYVDTAIETISNLVTGIKDQALALIEKGKAQVTQLIEDAKKLYDEILELRSQIPEFGDQLGGVMDNLITEGAARLDTLLCHINDGIDALKFIKNEIVAVAIETISSGAQELVNGAVSTITGVITKVQDSGDALLTLVQEKMGAIMESVISTVERLVQSVIDHGKELIQDVLDRDPVLGQWFVPVPAMTQIVRQLYNRIKHELVIERELPSGGF